MVRWLSSPVYSSGPKMPIDVRGGVSVVLPEEGTWTDLQPEYQFVILEEKDAFLLIERIWTKVSLTRLSPSLMDLEFRGTVEARGWVYLSQERENAMVTELVLGTASDSLFRQAEREVVWAACQRAEMEMDKVEVRVELGDRGNVRRPFRAMRCVLPPFLVDAVFGTRGMLEQICQSMTNLRLYQCALQDFFRLSVEMGPFGGNSAEELAHILNLLSTDDVFVPSPVHWRIIYRNVAVGGTFLKGLKDLYFDEEDDFSDDGDDDEVEEIVIPMDRTRLEPAKGRGRMEEIVEGRVESVGTVILSEHGWHLFCTMLAAGQSPMWLLGDAEPRARQAGEKLANKGWDVVSSRVVIGGWREFRPPCLRTKTWVPEFVADWFGGFDHVTEVASTMKRIHVNCAWLTEEFYKTSLKFGPFHGDRAWEVLIILDLDRNDRLEVAPEIKEAIIRREIAVTPCYVDDVFKLFEGTANQQMAMRRARMSRRPPTKSGGGWEVSLPTSYMVRAIDTEWRAVTLGRDQAFIMVECLWNGMRFNRGSGDDLYTDLKVTGTVYLPGIGWHMLGTELALGHGLLPIIQRATRIVDRIGQEMRGRRNMGLRTRVEVGGWREFRAPMTGLRVGKGIASEEEAEGLRSKGSQGTDRGVERNEGSIRDRESTKPGEPGKTGMTFRQRKVRGKPGEAKEDPRKPGEKQRDSKEGEGTNVVGEAGSSEGGLKRIVATLTRALNKNQGYLADAKKKLTFDGANITEFLIDYENLAALLKWSEEEKMQHVSLSLGRDIMAIIASSGSWKETRNEMMRKYMKAEKMATEVELAAVQTTNYATYNDFLRAFTLVALQIPEGERINWNSQGGMRRAVIILNNLDISVVEAEPVADIVWDQPRGRGPQVNFILEGNGQDRVNITTRRTGAEKKLIRDTVMEEVAGTSANQGETETGEPEKAYGKAMEEEPIDKAVAAKKKFRYQISILTILEIDDTLNKLLGTMVFRRMLAVARDMFPEKCEPYINDNPIKGAQNKDETEVQSGIRKFVWDHLQDIKDLLQRFLVYNITTSGPKSILAVPQVTILGFRCGVYGRKPDPAKTDKISQWPTPLRTTTEARAFLGVVGFWRIFIKGFAKIVEPIRAMIREGGTMEWTADREAAVQTLKEILVSDQVTLAAPCFNDEVGRPFTLETDGGPLAVRGVLIQRSEEGKERPIRFESRTLNSAERRYSQFKKEVLAILHCLKTFQAYLFGRRFILRIDPTNVAGALKNHKPIDPTIGRRIGFIWQFDYKVEYILDARDNLSGYVEAVTLKRKIGKGMVDWIEDFYLRHPFVRRFIADNETEFVNHEVLSRLKMLCVPIKIIEPYHPEANAPVEKGHRTLKNTIAKLAANNLGNWPWYLKQAVFSENMTPKRTTGCIPAELWYGREIDFPVEALVPTWNMLDDNPHMSTEELIATRYPQVVRNEEALEDVVKCVMDSRMRDTARWDQVKNIQKEPLQVGEMVLVRNFALKSTRSGQLGRRFKGPYMIAKRVGLDTFELVS
ncbi:hypothetical protein CBR_g13079 [Chara braunii]|uniref:Integrase catalytic domain-containing protein n=1 Tax=Chara braunii TaxID=69332 RepID=A0A388KTJ5_CHABU|nr:hypothetical protein CBR_g13079 [Chara braunii]|eukprot:GBG73359.1 hypothetical protein CBR_g13079 [Chara braunii]